MQKSVLYNTFHYIKNGATKVLSELLDEVLWILLLQSIVVSKVFGTSLRWLRISTFNPNIQCSWNFVKSIGTYKDQNWKFRKVLFQSMDWIQTGVQKVKNFHLYEYYRILYFQWKVWTWTLEGNQTLESIQL